MTGRTKRGLSACTVLAGSALASSTAHAGVELYGLLSAGVFIGDGLSISDESVAALSEQGHNSNRWGLRGSEDLGGGKSLRFTLESNLSLRSGAAGRDAGGSGIQSSGSLFDREAHLALADKSLGTLRAGRGKNLLYDLADEFDARGNWNFAALKPVARYAGFYGGSGISRFDNMLRYSSPSLAGLSLDAAYSFGGIPGSSSASASYVFGGRYELSGVELGYAHGEHRRGAVQTDTNQRIDLLVTKTRIGKATLNLGYARTRNPTGGGFDTITPTATVAGRTSADTWFAGLRYPWSSAMTFNAGYYDVRDKATGGSNDVRMLAVGVVHAVSKRTELYIDLARAWRDDGATAPFTLFDRFRSDQRTPSESARNQSGLNIGIQHRF